MNYSGLSVLFLRFHERFTSSLKPCILCLSVYGIGTFQITRQNHIFMILHYLCSHSSLSFRRKYLAVKSRMYTILYIFKLRFCEMNLKETCVTFVLALLLGVYSRVLWLTSFLQCLDQENMTCWWVQNASTLGLICPQLRVSVGTNSPLSTPAHYTTSWETSGVYFGIKMGQYLCGMWNTNNVLWEYYTGPEKGGGLFIRNKSFAVLPASDENPFLSGFVESKIEDFN